MSVIWNPWHGCVRYSSGCLHCYVYRTDGRTGRDPTVPSPTASFDLPVRTHADGSPFIAPGTTVFTCLTSDFFLDTADAWRTPAWDMIRRRDDLHFVIITKRIERAAQCLPEDWGGGWRHVTVCATMEDQAACDRRLPALLALPLRHRAVICEPLLGPVVFGPTFDRRIESVTAGGESGPDARLCRYEWVLSLRGQCREAGVAFRFKQTGANFERDGRVYRIPRAQQLTQAVRAGIDLPAPDPALRPENPDVPV